MNLALVVGITIAVTALVYVLAPLLWPRTFDVEPATQLEPEDEVAALERLRDDFFARIVELDFDHEVGKADEEEYREERAGLKRQALAVLRLLDERPGDAAASTAVDDVIERDVRAARQRRAVAAKRAVADTSPAEHCTNCGCAFAEDDRFCAGCGTPNPATQQSVPDGVAVAEDDLDATTEAGLDDEVECQVRALRHERQASAVPAAPARSVASGRRSRARQSSR